MPLFRTVNSTNTTMKIHHHTPAEWQEENEILAQGEFGLEDGTFLLKIGDGITAWNNLRYLNKLDSTYFTYLADGTVTFSQAFQDLLDEFVQTHHAVVPQLTITNNPIDPDDAVTKLYVDQAIAQAGVLHHSIVQQLPSVEEADENTVYLVPEGNDEYGQYILMGDHFESLGTTVFELQPATLTTLGGVRGSQADNQVYVTQQGFMTLNRVSTSLLYVPDGDTFGIYGGTATQGV